MFLLPAVALALLVDDLQSGIGPRKTRTVRFPSWSTMRRRLADGLRYDQLIEDGLSEEDAWLQLEDEFQDVVGDLMDLEFPLLVYRAISADDVFDIDLDRIGMFWSWDPEAAEPHWGYASGKKKYFLVVGRVDGPMAVSWADTVYANVELREEKEILLKEGAKIKILKIVEAPELRGMPGIVHDVQAQKRIGWFDR